MYGGINTDMKQTPFFRILIFACCILLLGCGSKSPGKSIWEKKLKGHAYGSAAVGDDGTVYFCMPPWIYAVSGKTGSIK